MKSVPITTKTSTQHYPAFSLPTHTNESLQAVYAKQMSVSPRSVSVIATTSNYNPTNYMGAIHENPYKFLTQPHSVNSFKTLCSATPNLPTLLRASLEANLRGMVAGGKIIICNNCLLEWVLWCCGNREIINYSNLSL